MNAVNLGFNEDLSGLRNSYMLHLSLDRITLDGDEDNLYWFDLSINGPIFIRNIHNHIASSYNGTVDKCWFSKAWSLHLPKKILMFWWLLWKNKILTWHNLRKRGFQGPCKCPLCHCTGECITHLFIDCIVAKETWEKVLHRLGINTSQNYTSIESCFKLWMDGTKENRCVPF